MSYMIALFVVVSLILFVQKVVVKSRLERGLGREVKERDLTSISAWMKAKPNAPYRNSRPRPGNRVYPII